MFGWLTNRLMILAEVSAHTKKPISPITYVNANPYKVALSVCGAIAGFIFFVDDLSDYPMIYGIGLMADMVLDRIMVITGKATNGKGT